MDFIFLCHLALNSNSWKYGNSWSKRAATLYHVARACVCWTAFGPEVSCWDTSGAHKPAQNSSVSDALLAFATVVVKSQWGILNCILELHDNVQPCGEGLRPMITVSRSKSEADYLLYILLSLFLTQNIVSHNHTCDLQHKVWSSFHIFWPTTTQLDRMRLNNI